MTRIVLALIAAGVLCTVVMVLVLLGSDLAERRAKRRRLQRVDPVEQAYADTVGIALDVPPAPATDELPAVAETDVNGLVVEIYRHQIRAHFKSIYGEDGQA